MICYFFFQPWEQAEKLLDEHAPMAEKVYTGPDDHGYWREMKARWTGEEDLICIEQDVGIHEKVVPQFTSCDQLWCTFSHQMRPGTWNSQDLGCVRFSAELQRMVSPADIEKEHMNPQCEVCMPFCWRHIDGPVNAAMAKRGMFTPHVHQPPVDHYHYLLGDVWRSDSPQELPSLTSPLTARRG